MNHNWAQVSFSTPYQAYLKIQTLAVSKKMSGKIVWNLSRGEFFINHRNCSCLLGTELGTDNSQYSGYITRLLNWMNSYWMFWIGGLFWRLSASSFCDLLQNDPLQFHSFSPGIDKSNPLDCFNQMCFIRRTIAYLCPNMINFDVVDFSEHRSEEVISFFWCSVYISPSCILMYQINLVYCKHSCLCDTVHKHLPHP